MSTKTFATSNLISQFESDNAATAEAPDSGFSFGLLFLPLIAVFGADRLRSCQLT